MSITRKHLAIGAGILVLAVVLIAVLVITLRDKDDRTDHEKRLARVRELLAESPVIDGHNDWPYQMRGSYQNKINDLDLNKQIEPYYGTGHTDIKKLRDGLVGAQFWAAYIPCSLQFKTAVRASVEQIDVIHRFTDKYPEVFEFARTAADIRSITSKGKMASLIGLESGHGIDSSLDTLRAMYRLGVRYMTLTHSCHTPWADSCTPKTMEHNGLTDFGELIVKEMNRLGMFVDISHVSFKTMKDVYNISKAPVIFSHSSAFALCDSPRNVPDDLLVELKRNKGVCMVNFANDYITCRKDAKLSDVADHIDHIKKVAGIEVVGLGADYDGVLLVPEGLEDVSKYPDLFAELMRRGYTDDEIKKVAGENLLRAMEEMEEVAKKLRASQEPYDEYHYINKTCQPAMS